MSQNTDEILAARMDRTKDGLFIFTLVGDDGKLTKRLMTDEERKRLISILKLGDSQ